MKHTKGPWWVCIDDTGGEHTGWPSVEAPKEIDASVIKIEGFLPDYKGDFSMREAVANARLIAAAPELLEALQSLLKLASENLPLEECEEYAQTKAAIQKATGE